VPQFTYRALNAAAAGQVSTGALDEPDLEAARAALRAKGLVPIDVRPANALEPLLEALSPDRLRPADQEWFFETLHTLIEAKLPVDEAVATIEEIAPRERLAETARRVRSALMSGSDLAAAVSRVRNLADERTVAVLRVGMESGRIAHALELIARSMRTRREIRATVGSKLTYPLILFAASVLAVWFLATFVIPRFAETLTAAGAELPVATRITLVASQHAVWAVPTVALVFTAVAVARPWKRIPGLADKLDELTLRMPIVGPLRWNAQAVTVADTLATVVEGGGEIVPALRHAADAVRSPILRARIEAASKAVREGRDLGDAISANRVLPPMSAALVRVGMRSGGLVEALRTAVRTSLDAQQAITARLLTLMEPATIVFLGAAVAWIVYSLIAGMLAINELGGL